MKPIILHATGSDAEQGTANHRPLVDWSRTEIEGQLLREEGSVSAYGDQRVERKTWTVNLERERKNDAGVCVCVCVCVCMHVCMCMYVREREREIPSSRWTILTGSVWWDLVTRSLHHKQSMAESSSLKERKKERRRGQRRRRMNFSIKLIVRFIVKWVNKKAWDVQYT